jgi:hypothetical protein
MQLIFPTEFLYQGVIFKAIVTYFSFIQLVFSNTEYIQF